MEQFAGNYQLSNQKRGPLAGPSCVRVVMCRELPDYLPSERLFW